MLPVWRATCVASRHSTLSYGSYANSSSSLTLANGLMPIPWVTHVVLSAKRFLEDECRGAVLDF